MTRPAIVLLLTLSCASPALAACEGQSLGAGVTLPEATPVAAILDAPESFVGKDVRVEGKVHEVCEMAGCWMELEAADASRVLKVKVNDGDIVFPVAARGKQAIAQGKVERLEMSRARYVRHLKHLAEEQDRQFDESTVVGDGPFLVYQVAGTGARVCG
jgi:hypothetical protein